MVTSPGIDEPISSSPAWTFDQIARVPGPVLDCALDPANIPAASPAPDGVRPNYLHTCGSWILDSYGREFRVVGITWSGMEYTAHSPLGLYSRNWHEVLDQITGLSYNTLRLPYTNDMLQPGVAPTLIDYQLNPDLRGLSALEVLDRLVEGARERGLRVILDRHRPTGAAQTPLWYTPEVPEEQWIGDWQMLVRRYQGNDTVVGVDLHNEPHGRATWASGDKSTDWRMAAERAGNALLEVNPYLLVFVQGIDRQGDDLYWWGGDLRGVARQPVELTVPNRVVYSPRDYGPEVYPQGYFSDPRFPDNLPEIWDEHWGYIQKQQIGPVVMGEMGGSKLDDSPDGRWKRALLNYLEANGIGYINWALEPSTFGDPSAVHHDAITTILDTGRLFRASMGIPDSAVEAVGSRQGVAIKALHKSTQPAEKTGAISFAVKARSAASRPIELSRIEMRYWLTAAAQDSRSQSVRAQWANSPSQNVHPGLVPASPDGRQFYLRLTFDPSAGTIQPFSDSDEIQVELQAPARRNYIQSDDYSYSPNTTYQESTRITLYLDGVLIWGTEP